MLFPTLVFGVFFLFVYFTAWSLDRENGRRKLFLLLASWFFYAQWDWRFVALLIASAVLNWGVGALIARQPGAKKAWLVGLGVAANLLILGFFKYYGFFIEQAGDLLMRFGWERDLPLLQIVLPVGISFFTFQGISYVVDVHRGKTPPAKNLLDVMLLMSFFPHLVAGPIVRASDLLPQFDRAPRLTREMATYGLLLIVWGLFKKTVIASELSIRLVDPVFFDPSAYSGFDIAAATYGYAVQIYCDFSAYSDMAIGLAALLGYSFPRNFDQPYRASSLQSFWRRWHISLSSWLRDYLYVPLGGGRKGLASSCVNVFITMLDLPGLGGPARRGAGHRAAGPGGLRRPQGGADRDRGAGHIPRRLPRLDPVPCREFRSGHGHAAGAWPGRAGDGADALAADPDRRRPGHALAAAARHRRCGRAVEGGTVGHPGSADRCGHSAGRGRPSRRRGPLHLFPVLRRR